MVEWGGDCRHDNLHIERTVYAGEAQTSMCVHLHGDKGLKYVCYDNQTYARNPKDTGDVCCTLQAHCGTGGNVLPFAHCVCPATPEETEMKGVTYAGYVRRLTTVECARLQGFPDHHTEIPWNGKKAPQGAQYRAYGNSMCVPVIEWIGKQIEHEINNPQPLKIYQPEQMEFDF